MTASSNPRQYTAADRIGWDRYAAQFRAFLNGTAPYPGDPPEGYREVYRLSQHFAPLPEEYSSRVLEAQRAHRRDNTEGTLQSNATTGEGGRNPTAPTTGVTMTDRAFNTFMENQSRMQQQLLQLTSSNRVRAEYSAPAPFHERGRFKSAGRGGRGGRGGGRGGRGGLRGRLAPPGRGQNEGPGGGERSENARERRSRRRQRARAQRRESTAGEASQASGSGSNSQEVTGQEQVDQAENKVLPEEFNDPDLLMADDFDDEDASRM
ncbi:uncharacterized protein C8Q71DRAFT_857884 [Rhodofomes roseus]|uniref:Uncharacterized protein n=1 Tax=Rhodofomes roseus TaxID=34475 RepID=A0ABQ8KFT8_9APHY|nr:uncharacterized protein C8Q71DRAFT_857884 [Rhodofomes roseus]KAH9836666.1 hypothetical protein C8Q71DRAFT_857884 [Rhodofomes roseus]